VRHIFPHGDAKAQKNTELKPNLFSSFSFLCTLSTSVRGFLERISVFNPLFSCLKKVNAFALQLKALERTLLPHNP
jgi:hypothetical protein